MFSLSWEVVKQKSEAWEVEPMSEGMADFQSYDVIPALLDQVVCYRGANDTALANDYDSCTFR